MKKTNNAPIYPPTAVTVVPPRPRWEIPPGYKYELLEIGQAGTRAAGMVREKDGQWRHPTEAEQILVCSECDATALKLVIENEDTSKLPPWEGFQRPEDEAVKWLLKHVPKEGGKVSKDDLERIIRAAFRGGVVAATH